jgi:uncharacterized protein (TIGR02271 family)
MADMDRNNLGGDLVRLHHSDFEVAEGYPNIRGWDVVSPDGQKLGKVDDLIVSPGEMRVRYLDVDVDSSVRSSVSNAAGGDAGHALVPIGTAQLDDTNDRVIVSSLSGSDLGAYPRYDRAAGISRDYESTLRGHHKGAGAAGAAGAAAGAAAGNFYDDDHYDDSRLFAGRGGATGDQRLTLHEEQLAVGKQQVQQGEVELHKRVETEHVTEQVPLTREEVTVERRPLSGDAAANARIGENQEIRVPVMREEAIVEKRAVAKEQVIVRKRAVTENQTVEADLRREELTVDRDVSRGTMGTSGTAGTMGGSTAGTSGGSLADKARNAVDDVKDRVDGNPASRPGLDPTDRR